MTNKCEGTCCAEEFDGHGRDGRRVRVTGDDGRDWGIFHYCDEAIASDESRGFTVCTDISVSERLDRLLRHDGLYRWLRIGGRRQLLGLFQ